MSELTASMVKAALAVAAICGVGLFASERGIPSETVGFFFGSTLLGVWGLLLASKPFEGSRTGSLVRSLVNVTTGVGVGLSVGLLGAWLHVVNTAGPFLNGTSLGTQTLAWMIYFGLGYLLLGGWFRVADRDRKGHVRLVPVLATILLMIPLWPLWPTQDIWSVWFIPAVTLVTQAVSPWNKQAAAYRLYVWENKAANVA